MPHLQGHCRPREPDPLSPSQGQGDRCFYKFMVELNQVDKFLSISGYKRRQASVSKPAASLRSPRGTSPPTPPPPPAPDTNRPPPPRVPCYPPPRAPSLSTSSGHMRQSHPQHQPHFSNQYRHKKPYYDYRQRQQYSRSVGWGNRDYRADRRTYISPSDDPLAAFQVRL